MGSHAHRVFVATVDEKLAVAILARPFFELALAERVTGGCGLRKRRVG